MASTTVDPTAVVLEVLNQFSNYKRWSLALENYLVAEDLWDVVAYNSEPPKVATEAELKAWMKSNTRDNARALRIIRNCCGPYNSNLIEETRSAKEAWETLAKHFEPFYADFPGLVCSDTAIDDSDTRHLSNKKELEPDSDSKKEEIGDSSTDKDKESVDNLEDFFKDVESGNWLKVMEFLDKNQSAVRVTIPNLGCSTVLHAAVVRIVKEEEVHFVEKLVEMMKEEDLEIKNKVGYTALYYAVRMDKIKMAKCMVEKCKKLLSIEDSDGWLPVLRAYEWDMFDMARYLYYQTPLAALKSQNGAALIAKSFTKDNIILLDIAWHLLRRCPSLIVATTHFGHSPINALAGKRSAFLSGVRLEFWEKWIYNCMGSFRQLLTNVLKLLSSGKRIYQMKWLHVQSLEVLRFMCQVIKNKNLNERQLRFVQSAIFRAVDRGHIEFITHMLKENPGVANMMDTNGMNMFQYAVACRQEKVYNLIYGFSEKERRDLTYSCVDYLNTTLLHIVGRLPPYAQFDRIKDAALRMQRELHWFKEVESIVPQTHGDLMNMIDNMTPHELFKKEHKELMKEAENTMKGTATSCTVVGSLIITTMFAAALTVPGGNKGDIGMVYIVSDGISLCSSTTSVIIFLGILTSRYSEVDFHKSLPTKMIFGLIILFISIITMMIAFGCAVHIMLEKRSSTIGPAVILLGCIPVLTFVMMQFHLLKDMLISTYGPNIFQKKIKPWRA